METKLETLQTLLGKYQIDQTILEKAIKIGLKQLRVEKALPQTPEEHKSEYIGMSIDEAAQWIANGIPEDYDVTQDSLYNLKGRDSNAPADLSLSLEEYLYGEGMFQKIVPLSRRLHHVTIDKSSSGNKSSPLCAKADR
jgi:hypothetical protein